TVTTSGGTSAAKTFTVTASTPHITGINNAATGNAPIYPTDVLGVYGTALAGGTTSVKLVQGTSTFTVSSGTNWSVKPDGTQVNAPLPAGVVAGTVNVTVTNANGTSNTVTVTITVGTPVISGINNAQYGNTPIYPGSIISIYGTKLTGGSVVVHLLQG